MIKFARAAVVALALWAVTSADATVFRFKFTGAYSADFLVDTEDAGAHWDFVDDIQELRGTGTFAGNQFSNVLLVLYGGGEQGLDIYSPGPEGIFEVLGARLYNYPWENAAHIVPKSFSLYDDDGDAIQLVISDPSLAPPLAVPEPSIWAMMMVGFGTTGLVLRRGMLRRAGRAGAAA
jgi:hypothetical protein